MSDDQLLVTKVSRMFREGPPNGWVLGWNRDRFVKEISKLSHPGEFENVTSFDYSFCNSFEVSFRKSSDEFIVLTVRISFVANYFSTHWTQYSAGGRHGTVVEAADQDSATKVAERIRRFLTSEGFRELPEDWASMVVPDARLELSEGPATLTKCLFDDYA